MILTNLYKYSIHLHKINFGDQTSILRSQQHFYLFQCHLFRLEQTCRLTGGRCQINFKVHFMKQEVPNHLTQYWYLSRYISQHEPVDLLPLLLPSDFLNLLVQSTCTYGMILVGLWLSILHAYTPVKFLNRMIAWSTLKSFDKILNDISRAMAHVNLFLEGTSNMILQKILFFSS